MGPSQLTLTKEFDLDSILIRPAKESEAAQLSEIAIEAKSHWNYPPELIETWRAGMEITPDTIRDQQILVAESSENITGFAGLSFADGTIAELTDLWVLPKEMGKGIGNLLLRRAIDVARKAGVQTVKIASDPNAQSFYERFGAQQIGWQDSKPTGRQLPVLAITLNHDSTNPNKEMK